MTADPPLRQARTTREPLGTPRRFATFEALRSRQFRLLWLGQVCSGMGSWMDQISRGWLMYELTGSPLQLGAVRAVQAVPFLLLSPIAGSFADRYDRKRQLVLVHLADSAFHGLLA